MQSYSIQELATFLNSSLQQAGINKPNQLFNLVSILEEVPINQAYSFMDILYYRISEDEFQTSIPEESTQNIIQDLADSNEEYKFFMYGRKSSGTYKQIEFKELKKSYAASAIYGEISTALLHTSADIKGTISNILTTIILDPEYIYVSKTNKIILNIDDSLYLTERYEKPFIAKDRKTEELLHDINILFVVMGYKHNKKEITVDNLSDYIVEM